MPSYEHYDLHPRAAHWITSRGDVYLHEMRLSNLGIADFVTINCQSGQLSIVECKLSEMSSGDPIEQTERYSRAFEGLFPRRIALFLEPISIAYRAYLLDHKMIVFVVGDESPHVPIVPRKHGIDIFNEVFRSCYRLSIEDHIIAFDAKRDRAYGKEAKDSPLSPRLNKARGD